MTKTNYSSNKILSPFSCPHCFASLYPDVKTWRCARGHAFDVGRAGDINLLLPQHKRSRAPGDSKPMVTARCEFLRSGVYQPIAETVAHHVRLAKLTEPACIADAGCGEGYYLRHVKHLCYPQSSAHLKTQFIGWDISKFAAQSASKQADFGTWLTASNAHIPLHDNSIDIVLSLFGFDVSAEFARILKPQGYVLTADTGEHHLLALRQHIYPEIKPYREKPRLDAHQFTLIKRQHLRYKANLNAVQLKQLLLMTPHFFRVKSSAKARLHELKELTVCIDVLFRLYQRRTCG